MSGDTEGRAEDYNAGGGGGAGAGRSLTPSGGGGAGRGYNAGGSMVGYPRPDEVVVPLRRDEFDTLCDGAVGEERANRDLYIGGAIGSFIGLVGVLVAAAADWDGISKSHLQAWTFLIASVILIVLTTGSVAGACVYHANMKRTLTNSAFSRVKARLEGLFNERRPPDDV